jgi:outer membrane protein, heavy metal efflux system
MWTPSSSEIKIMRTEGQTEKVCLILTRSLVAVCFALSALLSLVSATDTIAATSTDVTAPDLDLNQLINAAVKNNPELQAAGSRARASEFRPPQVSTLPDPIVAFGYQNDGFGRYSYGQSSDSQWAFSVSQAIPFPGKLSLKGDAAQKEAYSLADVYSTQKLKTIARVKEIYFDLFAAHKAVILINERVSLFTLVENLALSRYSAGKASQIDVLGAQTEKYLLIEKEILLKQNIDALEAALNATLGRRIHDPVGRPTETRATIFHQKLDELIAMAIDRSPEIRSKSNLVLSAEAKLSFAKRDYMPDFILSGTIFNRGRSYDNMWSLTVGINIPIFYLWKQNNAVKEAEASLAEAKSQKEAAVLAVSSSLRENLAQMKASSKLMSLYRYGLIPKSRQDIEFFLANYQTGASDAQTIITKLKSVLDYEIGYWTQFGNHEKAAARIEALTGMMPGWQQAQ